MNDDVFSKFFRAMQAQQRMEEETLAEAFRMLKSGASPEECEEWGRTREERTKQAVRDAVERGTQAAPSLPSDFPPGTESILQGLLGTLTGKDATPMLSAAPPAPKRKAVRKRAVKPKPVRTGPREGEE